MAALEVKLHGKTPPPASLVPLPFQGRLVLRGDVGIAPYTCKKGYSPAKLHTNSNAHVNSFTTAGMVSMDTSVVTAKM